MWVSDVADKALSGIAGSLATIAVGFLAFRRRLSSDNTEITKDKTAQWQYTSLRTEITDLRAERDAAATAAKDAVNGKMQDAVTIARLELKLENAELRLDECEERTRKAEARASQAEEHFRQQGEQILLSHMHADTAHAALARTDPETSAKLATALRHDLEALRARNKQEATP